MSEERLEKLEILVSQQEKVIAELSDMVASQWKTMDEMKARLDGLLARVSELEEYEVDRSGT